MNTASNIEESILEVVIFVALTDVVDGHDVMIWRGTLHTEPADCPHLGKLMRLDEIRFFVLCKAEYTLNKQFID